MAIAARSITPSETLLPRLQRVRQTAAGQWIASCPGPLHANGDRHPSLSIAEKADSTLLVCCYAGCGADEILGALGLQLRDLYPEPLTHFRKPLAALQRRRHNQASEALKALAHEVRLVWCLAEQVSAGYALDDDELKRLKISMGRISAAERYAS